MNLEEIEININIYIYSEFDMSDISRFIPRRYSEQSFCWLFFWLLQVLSEV